MKQVGEAQVALMLLTRLPAGRLGSDVPPMGQTLWAWPLVGLFLGGCAALCMFLLTSLNIAPLVAGIATLALLAALTGGLHEDGLADVADGFGGGQNRAAKLDIMRDSRVGSYGVLALILVIALKLAAMIDMTTPNLIAAFLITATASRALMALPLLLLPAARKDGLGAKTRITTAQTCLAAITTLLLALIVAGTPALIAIAAMTLAALAMTYLAKRQIGGQTGDVCGATQMLADTTGWIALSALL